MAKDMERMLKRSIGHKPQKPRAPAKAGNVATAFTSEQLDAIDRWRGSRHLTRAEAVAELTRCGLQLFDQVGRLRR